MVPYFVVAMSLGGYDASHACYADFVGMRFDPPQPKRVTCALPLCEMNTYMKNSLMHIFEAVLWFMVGCKM